jgi:hypothetical protein
VLTLSKLLDIHTSESFPILTRACRADFRTYTLSSSAIANSVFAILRPSGKENSAPWIESKNCFLFAHSTVTVLSNSRDSVYGATNILLTSYTNNFKFVRLLMDAEITCLRGLLSCWVASISAKMLSDFVLMRGATSSTRSRTRQKM